MNFEPTRKVLIILMSGTCDFLANYRLWRCDEFFDEETRCELEALDEKEDIKEIEDRFYTHLEFGTGGLRGVMGAGINRMNKYTVGRATFGLGMYLIGAYGKDACRTKGVVIGFDTRNNSRFFSETAARVLSSMGIRVYIHSEARPTPQLSFSVRHFGALAGIVLTASHNPKEYNGYKVYDETGCQLVPDQAEKILACINRISDFREVPFDGDFSLVKTVDVTDDFVKAALLQKRFYDEDAKKSIKIVYTPLHGTGRIPMLSTLKEDGFLNVEAVSCQMTEDGNFPTVISPNPEDMRALLLGIERAKECDADIVLGTDPDCDRVGVAVKTSDGYTLMTGNQIGSLLMDFVLSNTDLSALKKPAVVKTVVTSELGAEIALKKGAYVFTTLTGFKYIGEKITQFENAAKSGDNICDYTYVFGYEESYGYLAGTHARDKDAVVSGMLICEMAAYFKSMGKTLCDRMEELYSEYGCYLDALDSFTLSGRDGLEKIKSMMEALRSSESPFDGTSSVTDYLTGVPAEKGFGTLPTSDVLKYILCDGSWVAIRPSGTEPKIKIYYSIKEQNREKAEDKLQKIRTAIKSNLGIK